jgi:regulator of sirC expression with transglutaminase-like and TPR domain
MQGRDDAIDRGLDLIVRAVQLRYGRYMVASPRERFARLVSASDENVDLAEAALLIAAEVYPGLDVGDYLGRLDRLAAQARPLVTAASSDEQRVEALNRFLFVDQGFAGNRADYDDPKNSFLNEVIDRRKGIPITLTLVYTEVARRLDLPVLGVGFPGHFLAKYSGRDEIIIDAFFGQVLSKEQCRDRLRALFGARAELQPHHLRPATVRETLVRMLSNLKHVHLKTKELEPALSYTQRILLVRPDDPYEIRDRGLLYAQLECYGAAQADLARFLELAPGDETADTIREHLVEVGRLASQIQ